MNKVILMGRLTRDPEIRYSQGESPVAVVRFGIAVNKRFKRDGEPDADFFNCVAFGKTGEFTNKYFKKGMMMSLVGRLSVNSWTDNNNQKRTSTEIIVEEQYFAESKAAFEASRANYAPQQNNNPAPSVPSSQPNDFYNVDTSVDDDNLPF